MKLLIKLHLALAILLIALSSVALAGTSDNKTRLTKEESLGLIEDMYIEVNADVDDGCWTNKKAFKKRLRHRLESEGIKISDEKFFLSTPKNPNLIFSVLGFRSGDLCVCSYNVFVGTPDGKLSYGTKKANTRVDVANFALLWKRVGLFTSSDPNKKMLELANTIVDSLVADIAAQEEKDNVYEAGDKFFTELPVYTEREFLELIEEED